MSTAPLFADYSPSYADTADENTVMTDYWLEFVSVRQRPEEPAPATLQSLESLHPPHFPEFRNSVRERLKNNFIFSTIQKLF